MGNETILITGTSRGIGKYLAHHYSQRGFHVYGCSRNKAEFDLPNYTHTLLDVTDESAVKQLMLQIRRERASLDILINNAAIASMNHALLTPTDTIRKIFEINVVGTFLFCREAAKLMKKKNFGRIVNFATFATPLKLEGEAAYASSKAAVVTLTQILARELGDMGITVNAIGPTMIKTDMIRSVSEQKLNSLLNRQAIKRFGAYEDVSNVIDFFILPESSFITGQVLYFGGI